MEENAVRNECNTAGARPPGDMPMQMRDTVEVREERLTLHRKKELLLVAEQILELVRAKRVVGRERCFLRDAVNMLDGN